MDGTTFKILFIIFTIQRLEKALGLLTLIIDLKMAPPQNAYFRPVKSYFA